MRLKDFVSWNNKKESTFFFSLIIYKHDIHIVHNILIFGKLKKNSKHLKFKFYSAALYSIKEISRTLVQRNVHFIINVKNTISKFGHWIIHNISSGEGCHNNFFFTVTCGEMRGNNWRNRISTTVHVFLGRKKRENRGKSFSVGCLLVHLVVICYFSRNYPSFLTPDTLVFPRKYSVSVSLTARNDRDKNVKSI